MGRIVRLPAHVANRIAAGEVVERPASVVKELLENSLDAGARRIRLELEGGVELIRVTDDGEGMEADDARLCFARHATSKLKSADDLERVATYGFRGEALAAIAAVSEVELITRRADGAAAHRVLVRAGDEVEFGLFPSGPGTTVSVRRLFFNAPARRRFLRSAGAERRACVEAAQRLALARPDVAFELRLDGEVRFATPGDGDTRSAAAAVLGPELAAMLVAVSACKGPVQVEAWMGPASEHRPSRSHLWVYVNGRWVDDRMVATAAARAYESALPPGRYPVGIVRIVVDPSLVDVNVHPAKLYVRFRDEGLIFATVMAAVRDVLRRAPVPGWVREAPALGRPPQPSLSGAAPAAGSLSSLFGPQGFAGESPASYRISHPDAAKLVDAPSLVDVPSLRVVGQIFRTYLIAEAAGALLIVDQHVAHERLIYERLQAARQARHSPAPSQRLLEPVTVTLSSARSQVLQELVPTLAELGLEVEPFGPLHWRVRAVPVEPGLPAPEDPRQLAELLEAVADAGASSSVGGARGVLDVAADRLLKTVACRSAVKAGQHLPPAWWERLVVGLAQADNPYTCPHGRPVVVQLSLHELHRRFGRPVPSG